MPEIIFNGPAGRLEGRYSHSKKPNAPLALVLHPNPQQGGTMNNRITYMMHQIFVSRGFSTMRFNFRGVGRSQGEFDEGEGELSDAAAALDWMQELNQNAPFVWVGGFAFGALMGMQLLMRRPEIRGYISVAPPAHEDDFSFLAPCPTSGLVLLGGRDEITPREPVEENLIERLRQQKGIEVDFQTIPEANHFFHNCEEKMVQTITAHLDKALLELAEKRAA